MQKRNWVGLSLLGGLLGIIAFGGYIIAARNMDTLTLEDIQGDRAYLEAFPIEGYGGDDVESVDFTIIHGDLQTQQHPYGADALGSIRKNKMNGDNKVLSYLYSPISSRDLHERTWIVPTKDAKQEHTQKNSMALFEQNSDAVVGETITADAVEVFCEVYAFQVTVRDATSVSGRDKIARFPTGIVLRDQPYVFAVGAEENYRFDYMNYRTNYTDGYVGEEYGENELNTYSTRVGDEIYTVVAPDERCEGSTYVYRVSVVDEEPWTYSGDDDFSYFVNRRDEVGTVEPIVPLPDAKESYVVGLEGIGEHHFALFHIKDNQFFADVYDTEGNLIGSVKKEMQWDTKWYEEQKKPFTLKPASEISCDQTIFEDGVSLQIDIRGLLEMEDNEKSSGSSYYGINGGELLLWVTENGVKQMPNDEKAHGAVTNGKQVFYWNIEAAKEGTVLDDIKGWGTSDQVHMTIIDAETKNLLYEGCLKTDFWQDKFTELARIDNTKENGYLQEREIIINEEDIRQFSDIRVMDWKE